jgi:glycosyltransferase involved in cell wall biosynthesis
MTLDPERLHVIRCYDRLPPMSGGMERHIAELTAAQRRMGVRVTELFNSGEPAGDAVQVWRGWRLDKVRPSVLRFAFLYGAAAARGIDLSDGRAPVVHAHGDWSAFLLGAAFGRFLGAKAVAATLHEWARAPRRLYELGLKGCDPIFATGFQEARHLSDITDKPVIHLPSAPADLFFAPPSGPSEPVDVIAVGSLIARKRFDLLIECATLRPNLSFAVLGGGPMLERLERLRSERGVKNLRFRGAATPDEVRSALCSARLFINLSLTEGSPTSALEAMACGLPVVLTPSNDYSAIVEPGITGRVTSGWDVDEVARAIDEFLDDPARLASAREVARRTAEAHRWDAKARIVTDAMVAAIARRTSAGR